MRSVPQVAGDVAAASRPADSRHRRRGGWRWAAALCRGAIPAAVRIGPAADGNCHPGGPDRGRAAEVHQVDRRAARYSAPARRRQAALEVRARRIRPAAARAQEASAEPAVRASLSAARSQFPRGPSSRVLSAMRRRGRSLHVSFGVRRRGCRPLSSINYCASAPSHPGTRVRRSGPANYIDGVAMDLVRVAAGGDVAQNARWPHARGTASHRCRRSMPVGIGSVC